MISWMLMWGIMEQYVISGCFIFGAVYVSMIGRNMHSDREFDELKGHLVLSE